MSQEEYSEDNHSKRLSATMAMLSETYPIIVYYNKAIACGLPVHFMDLRFPPDKWGRVPCKREAMDWYLENGPINAEAKTRVDLKYKRDLETAQGYLSAVTLDVGEKDEGISNIQTGMDCDTANMK